MGKQLVKIGKSLKDQDPYEDLAMKFEQPMNGVRIPVNEQKDPSTCGVLHHHKYEVNPDMVARQEKAGLSLAAKDETDKHMEVKEDLVKSENFITENLRFSCFFNMTICCFILKLLAFNIKSVFLDKAARFSLTSSRRSTSYAASCPRSFNESTKFIEINTEKTGDFITEEAVKTEKALINMIIIGCCILMLAFIYKIISVFSDMAAKFATNYSSSSPCLDAKSCRSSTDGQTKSNFSPTTVSPGKVQQVFVNFRGEQLRYNFVSHLSDAFQRHDIKFFIDNYEQRGKDLTNLFVRIEESSIALAIFSSRYPESSWCMDELVKMKKLSDQGKLRVIPIFYKVEAEDVRKPTSDSEFGKKFWRLAEASSGDQIKNWKEALECISDKMGLSLGDKRSEADFVKETVKEVQRVIKAIGLEEE